MTVYSERNHPSQLHWSGGQKNVWPQHRKCIRGTDVRILVRGGAGTTQRPLNPYMGASDAAPHHHTTPQGAYPTPLHAPSSNFRRSTGRMQREKISGWFTWPQACSTKWRSANSTWHMTNGTWPSTDNTCCSSRTGWQPTYADRKNLASNCQQLVRYISPRTPPRCCNKKNATTSATKKKHTIT